MNIMTQRKDQFFLMLLFPCHYAPITALCFFVHTVNISTETDCNTLSRDPVAMTLCCLVWTRLYSFTWNIKYLAQFPKDFELPVECSQWYAGTINIAKTIKLNQHSKISKRLSKHSLCLKTDFWTLIYKRKGKRCTRIFQEF